MKPCVPVQPHSMCSGAQSVECAMNALRALDRATEGVLASHFRMDQHRKKVRWSTWTGSREPLIVSTSVRTDLLYHSTSHTIEKALLFENSWYDSVSWNWLHDQLELPRPRKPGARVKVLYYQRIEPALRLRWPHPVGQLPQQHRGILERASLVDGDRKSKRGNRSASSVSQCDVTRMLRGVDTMVRHRQ